MTVKPKALEWTAPAPPCEDCRYDHVRSTETPFGSYRIEWKGWKEHDGRVIFFGPYDDYVGVEDDLVAAKASAQRDFDERVLGCLSPEAPASSKEEGE